MPTSLMRDKDLARMIGMSCSWVRVERWKRKNGYPHVLKIDPIMIGGSPRYSQCAVEKWINSLERSS